MPEGTNAATELRHEHGEIDQLVSRVVTLGPGPARTRLLGAAAERFLTHARAEERYLLPVLHEHFPPDDPGYLDELRELHTVRELVDEIERTDEQDRRHNELTNRLVAEIEQHIEHQDTVLLPSLIDLLPYEEVNTLGGQLRSGFAQERQDGDG